MDIPVFHLDILNNRVLIGIIATLHVIINHGMAVGGIPLIAYLEHKGAQTGNPGWDRAAEKLLRSFFIVTTSLGAMTGVGIWFSVSLVNPYAIASLIRVFFWTWFVEWLVFVTEVVLILAYHKTWSTWRGKKKRAHVRLGFVLSFASWATMALIVSILAFMMDPGSWQSERTLFSGMLNPLYLPQLAFRTPLAMVMAGTYALVAVLWCTERGTDMRTQMAQTVARWTLIFTCPTVLGGIWYATRVPEEMAAHLPVAMLTQALETWSDTAKNVLLAGASLIAAVMVVVALVPRIVPRTAYVVPALTAVLMLGTFERVREFIRKPYAIAGYLYSNGFRRADLALTQRDGVLRHAVYTGIREITPENELGAGREVFTLTCTRCHTTDGINGMRAILSRMYGETSAWDASVISSYIATMHNARTFMPPFPGSTIERNALAAFLVSLQTAPAHIEGAQTVGAVSAPLTSQATQTASLLP